MRRTNKKVVLSVLYLFFIAILLMNVLKISFNDNVFLNEWGDTGLLYKTLFWILCAFYIFLGTLVCSLYKIRWHVALFIFLIIVVTVLANLGNLILWTVLIFWGVSGYIFENNNVKPFYILTLCLVLIIFLSTSLWNNGSLYYDQRYGFIETFGFENPNSYPQLLIILYLFLANTIKRAFVFSIIFLSLSLVFASIHTRSFYLLIIMFPFVFCILKTSTMAMRITSLIPFVFMVLSIFVSYNSSDFSVLNNLLSGRLYFSHLAVSDLNSVQDVLFGVSGDNINYPLDMSYVSVYYHHGIFGLMIILFLYTLAVNKLKKINNINEVAVIVGFLSYALVENVLINLTLNFTLYYVFKNICKRT